MRIVVASDKFKGSLPARGGTRDHRRAAGGRSRPRCDRASGRGRRRLAGAGLQVAYALTALAPDPVVSMREAHRLLEQIGEMIARQLAGWEEP
jgi:hypothetical protein